ncbi:MAG: adenylate/guanylate cyclase domain-containing protein [Deltaproteobacteria bacterium]|nr:adenylate/guanylate cyclase domain-containing protein [Deltaproteobacteria bacterium]
MSPGGSGLRYLAPAPVPGQVAVALLAAGGAGGLRFPFYERLEIGRDDPARVLTPGLLLVEDGLVSRHHCVVTRRHDGHCTVRDLSRNGTRLGGRRLVPNVETEWRTGDALVLGAHRSFLLDGDGAGEASLSGVGMSTIPRADRTIATVLVGDIRDYTVLVRRSLSEEMQRAVRSVFEALTAGVLAHGGTVKEFQGDAILAYWEGDAGGCQAAEACRAALALDRLACDIAADPARWPVADHPLELHWALSTGLVLIDSIGHGTPVGLSMMGEPVVRAFRMEKHAGGAAGRILACQATRDAAGAAFTFRDLGSVQAKGFDRPDRIHALVR